MVQVLLFDCEPRHEYGVDEKTTGSDAPRELCKEKVVGVAAGLGVLCLLTRQNRGGVGVDIRAASRRRGRAP